jgi:diadenosine tetraphosphatase ApaH/serine/threonine PP2A family protein phosphatase
MSSHGEPRGNTERRPRERSSRRTRWERCDRFGRIAVFGGVYSNHIALGAVLDDIAAQDVDAVFCLGDLGAFGPHPDRAIERLRQTDVRTLQGNYDHSIGHRLDDCDCGYTDPRDNHYAQLSYDYTFAKTSEGNRDWLRELPTRFEIRLGVRRVRMTHGSPRHTNEFLWESTTPEPFIRRLLDECDADLILCTHTGLHWRRFLAGEPGRGIVNVGAIGRPANNGDPAVWYALLSSAADDAVSVKVEFRRVEYDTERLAAEMRSEALPEEFVATILTGWWTTCLEVLPARERAASRY